MPTGGHDLSRVQSCIWQFFNCSGLDTVVHVGWSHPGFFAQPHEHAGQLIYTQRNSGVPDVVVNSKHPPGLQVESFCLRWDFAEIFLKWGNWTQRVAKLFKHSAPPILPVDLQWVFVVSTLNVIVKYFVPFSSRFSSNESLFLQSVNECHSTSYLINLFWVARVWCSRSHQYLLVFRWYRWVVWCSIRTGWSDLFNNFFKTLLADVNSESCIKFHAPLRGTARPWYREQ